MNVTLSPLTVADPQAVELLLDAAFGADRRERTAYRLREAADPVAALSFAAWDGTRLVGSLQSWPVALRTMTGLDPLIMVGPVAVLPEVQGRGVGVAMMDALIAAAGGEALIMIGDPDYYGRWGFTAEHTGGWRIDAGPYEPHRLLARLGREVARTGDLMPLVLHSRESGDPAVAAI